MTHLTSCELRSFLLITGIWKSTLNNLGGTTNVYSRRCSLKEVYISALVCVRFLNTLPCHDLSFLEKHSHSWPATGHYNEGLLKAIKASLSDSPTACFAWLQDNCPGQSAVLSGHRVGIMHQLIRRGAGIRPLRFFHATRRLLQEKEVILL